MKKRIFLLLSLFVFLSLALYAKPKPLSEQYKDRFEKTYIGMSFEEFKQVWPDAEYVGSGMDNTEMWKFTKETFISRQIIYFTFKDNKLIRFTER